MKLRLFVQHRLYVGLLLIVVLFLIAGCETVNVPSLEAPSENEDLLALRTQTGSLSGTVKDKSTRKGLGNVVITVVEPNLSKETNRLGRYTITGITPGKVTVVASRDGYLSQTRIVTIRKGKRLTLNFTLEKTQSANTSTPAPTVTPTPTPSVPVDLLVQYGWGKNTVVRWKDGTVDVYDATQDSGIDVAGILNTWNAIIGGATTFRLSTNSQSPVKIYYDAQKVTSCGYGVWGVTTVWWSNYAITRAEVAILPCGTYYGGMNLCPKPELYLHELGHAVGFGGHTSDGGVMDPAPRNTTITPTVRNVLAALYSLPVGYTLRKAPGVPKDGMAVIPMRWKEGE